MKSLRRVLNQIRAMFAPQTSTAEHYQIARAYRPVSGGMMPRWRILGTAITPYHFMRPALIPVRTDTTQKTLR